jgi:hypothetical protein
MRGGKPGIDLVSVYERPDCLSSYRYWLVVAESTRMDKTIAVTPRPFTMIVRLHGGYVEPRERFLNRKGRRTTSSDYVQTSITIDLRSFFAVFCIRAYPNPCHYVRLVAVPRK